MPTPGVADYRHMRSNSLSIPSPSPGASSPNAIMMNGIGLAHRVDAPAQSSGGRSPPNTGHVPCKFFRQGACQAGATCPFSHDMTAPDLVCKYFAKGNCKFGPKCANIHVLPDGRRINYGKNGVTIGGPPSIALGARVNPATYSNHPGSSALTNGFLRASGAPSYPPSSPYAVQDDRLERAFTGRPSENGPSTLDVPFPSNPTSVYGSPRDDDPPTRNLGGLSPMNKGVSALDAPLPASFDSHGISLAARYGPWSSSMPSKFFLDSPSPSSSLNAVRDPRTSDTLKLLHSSAFGSREHHLSPQPAAADIANGAGAGSPPAGSDAGLATPGAVLAGDEYFGKRPMHSSSTRYAKPRLMSSSAPKYDRDWDSQFLFEEDCLPENLADEVLTPAEKARRGSTNTLARPIFDGLDALSAGGGTAGSLGTAKFGSPATAASPSRWGTLFQRQREEEAAENSSNGGSLSGSIGSSFSSMAIHRPIKHGASAFGHVGSPLRNSSLASGLISAELDRARGPGSGLAATTGSGPRSGGGPSNDMLSVLTQQLQRTRLGGEGESSHASAGSSPSRNGATGMGSLASPRSAGVIGRERERGDGGRGLERHVSSGSMGSNSAAAARLTTPIDEEDTAFVFSMEEEEEQMRSRKRGSGRTINSAASPLSSGWSYNTATSSGPSPTTPHVGGASAGSGAVEAVGGR